MQNTVWNYIFFLYVNLNYYNRWYYKLARRNFFLKFGSALGTIIAIVCWSCWPNHPIRWTLLVTSGQILSLYAEYAGLSEKIMRLSYCAEDTQKIINKAAALWDEVDDIPDSEIRTRMQALRDEWNVLDARFLRGITPYDSKVLKLAEEDANDILENVYKANQETDIESNEKVLV